MDIDRYADLDSPVHRWDPRLKLLCLFGLVFVCSFLRTPVAHFLALALALAGFLVLLTRIPLRFVVRVLRVPLRFLVLLVPLLALTAGGPHSFGLAGIPLSREGFELGVFISLKALSITLILVAAFGTAGVHETLGAFESLRMPKTLLAIFLFTYRYVFLYLDDMRRLRTAAALRGHGLRGGRRGGRPRILALGEIMVMLLIRSYEHSERVYAAMQLRGFDGSYHTATDRVASALDGVKSVLLVGIACALLLLDRS